jgi:hypothetical protein
VLAQRDRHVDLQREAGGVRVDVGGDAVDHAGVLEPADAVQRRGGGELDDPGEVDVRAVGVALELLEQLQVNVVEFCGHMTKRYSV